MSQTQISSLPATTTFDDNTVVAVENVVSGSNVTSKLTGASLKTALFANITPKSGDAFGTSANPIYCGAFGFITSGGTAIEMFIPTNYIPESNLSISTSNVTICTGNLRKVSGGYVPSTDYDFTSYLTGISLVARTGQLRLLFSNTGGFGSITNNTPIVGTIRLAFTF